MGAARLVAQTAVTAPAGDAIRARGDLVPAFIGQHFRLRGTLRLHVAALGGDMLRAPANLILAPVYALVRLLALILSWLGAARMAAWLRGRRLLLPTRVGARVERAVITDLLGLDWPQEGPQEGQGDQASRLRLALLSAPMLRAAMRAQADPAGARALADRLARQIEDYAVTRTAVSEIVTALALLILGGVIFQALTPGMISLAPNVAGVVAHGVAVADFPLGQTLGGLWYGVFPVGVAPWLMVVVVIVLVMLGAMMAAFAGVLADPVQVRLGIHRRRLRRLIAALAATVDAAEGAGFATPEHALARVVDLWDGVTSLLRVFRG